MSFWGNIVELDRNLFVLLNQLHVDWLDKPFYYISGDLLWIPLYAFFIYLIISKFKKKAWVPILAILLAVTFSDQSSSYIKRTVKRLRPTHDETLRTQVHVVNNYRGGQFGFVSSHAANTFCVASLLSLLLNLSVTQIILLFLWASLVAYSRIYLGVHFPLDIVGGAFLGLIIGVLVHQLEKKAEKGLFYKA
jgi:undecaprenyl-diphosphatase